MLAVILAYGYFYKRIQLRRTIERYRRFHEEPAMEFWTDWSIDSSQLNIYASITSLPRSVRRNSM